jgi:kynureninase
LIKPQGAADSRCLGANIFRQQLQLRQGISRAIGHVRADLIARYNKDQAWEGRRDAFTRVSDHVATLIGARAGAAVIPLRG